MKKLKAWMAEHKKFSVIALCLLLMFTCGSAMSAINVSHHRAETAKEQNAGNIAVLITTMMGLVKSGSWAKEILGA